LAEFSSMFEHLQTAEALATALDDRHRLGWVSAYLAACYCNALKPREAEAAGCAPWQLPTNSPTSRCR
jgi:hypothetical protein